MFFWIETEKLLFISFKRFSRQNCRSDFCLFLLSAELCFHERVLLSGQFLLEKMSSEKFSKSGKESQKKKKRQSVFELCCYHEEECWFLISRLQSV